jgi:hypothetical protein
VRYFTVTVDEVTTIDNGMWLSVTIYFIQDFERQSLMAALEHMDDGTSSNNLTKAITKAICTVTNMECEEIATKMLAFGVGKLVHFFLPPICCSFI